jgi:probable HAF family extracellular repeat protein
MTLKMRSAAAAAALFAALSAHAGSLTLSTTFGAGTDFSAVDINDQGKVVGINGTANAVQTWQGGSFASVATSTDIVEVVGINNNGLVLYDTVNATTGLITYATSAGAISPSVGSLVLNGLNDAGTLAGYFTNTAMDLCGVTMTSTGTTLNTACQFGTARAYMAINNAGDRVAQSITGSTTTTTLETAAGTATVLGSLSSVAGINDTGMVAGVANGKAVRVAGGVTTDLLASVSGASNVKVYDINNAGQVVGQYTDTSGNAVAFLYGADGLTTLNSSFVASGLEWAENTRLALNNQGEMVATVFNGSDLASAVFMTPGSSVPEPSTYALMGLGLVGVSLVARRRRA